MKKLYAYVEFQRNKFELNLLVILFIPEIVHSLKSHEEYH